MAGPASSGIGRALLLLGRLALGAIFLYAAYAKLHPPPGSPWSVASLKSSALLFALQVDSYQLLPNWAVLLVAHTLPWLELVLGVLLVSGLGLRYAAAAASALLLVFFSVMVRSYSKGLEINCGCFGPGEALGVKTLARDGSLLVLSLAVTAAAIFRARPQPALSAGAAEMEKVD